jgi:hypothetical protein
MLRKIPTLVLALTFPLTSLPQLQIARDTIMVLEAGRVLRHPWAGGINNANVSTLDLNFDGKKDLVVFDRMNQYGNGRFRCFIHTGVPGELKYRHDPDISYYFPPTSYWALFRDFNGDGKEDLFSSVSGGIKVMKNESAPANVLKFTLSKALLYSNYNPGGNPSFSNLYAGSLGLPAINDIDGDSKPDVLTFSPLGTYIEYHRNVSVHPDSLQFELKDYCWGNISESSCSVSFGPCPFRRRLDTLPAMETRPYHSGACLTCLDPDGDNDQDLLLGDVECNTLQYVHNTGTATLASLTDTTKLYPHYPQKNANNTYVRMNSFPCAYSADVDNDGKRDLLASPNAFGSENYQSLWLYRNASSTPTANFQLSKKNFLQDEMIDVGQNAYPVLIDYDSDGRKDLLVGTHGYYENGMKARLTLYRNTGTLSQPVFSLVTRDYAGLGAQSLTHVMPAVGDVDGDGDTDILIGTSSGQVHWLENTAGTGNPCNFSVFKNNPFSFTTLSAVAAPQLFDLDKDGKRDLLIGTRNGRINWYRNTGSGSAVSFSLMSAFQGSVDVKGSSTVYGLDGFASPFFYSEGAATKLLVGSVTGKVHLYNVGSDLSQPFTLVSAGVNNYNEGDQATVWYEDINNDGKRDLFIGNASGGISFFSSASPFVGLAEMNAAEVRVYPNPASGSIRIEPSPRMVAIYDMFGREVIGSHAPGGELSVTALAPGIYYLKIFHSADTGERTTVKKIVKE